MRAIAKKVGTGGVAALAVLAVMLGGIAVAGARGGADDSTTTSTTAPEASVDDDGTPDQGPGDVPVTETVPTTAVPAPTVAPTPVPTVAPSTTIDDPQHRGRGTDDPAGDDHGGRGHDADGSTEATTVPPAPSTTIDDHRGRGRGGDDGPGDDRSGSGHGDDDSSGRHGEDSDDG